MPGRGNFPRGQRAGTMDRLHRSECRNGQSVAGDYRAEDVNGGNRRSVPVGELVLVGRLEPDLVP